MAPPTACNRSAGPAVEPVPVRPRHVVDAFGSVSYPRIPLRRPAILSFGGVPLVRLRACGGRRAHSENGGVPEGCPARRDGGYVYSVASRHIAPRAHSHLTSSAAVAAFAFAWGMPLASISPRRRSRRSDPFLPCILTSSGTPLPLGISSYDPIRCQEPQWPRRPLAIGRRGLPLNPSRSAPGMSSTPSAQSHIRGYRSGGPQSSPSAGFP